jgi:hypothetical protein
MAYRENLGYFSFGVPINQPTLTQPNIITSIVFPAGGGATKQYEIRNGSIVASSLDAHDDTDGGASFWITRPDVGGLELPLGIWGVSSSEPCPGCGAGISTFWNDGTRWKMQNGAASATYVAGLSDIPATIPIRAGTWSISSATSIAVTFATVMGSTPTSCSVTPGASAATTGTPFATSLATTGFTVNVPNSGTLAGTYQCVINNAN